MMNPFASKAYKEGWKAGVERNFGNPYEDEARKDNYRRGAVEGGSVHLGTRHKPYIDWNKGCPLCHKA